MTDRRKRIAVDTCVVLDFLVPVDEPRAERAKYLLGGHGDRYELVLPAIVIPEVAGAPPVRGADLLKADRERRVANAMTWIRRSNFIVAELSDRTSRRAAELAVAHQLKGPDASILATAEQWGCERLFTRDQGLISCNSDKFNFVISEPDEVPLAEEPGPHLFTVGSSD